MSVVAAVVEKSAAAVVEAVALVSVVEVVRWVVLEVEGVLVLGELALVEVVEVDWFVLANGSSAFADWHVAAVALAVAAGLAVVALAVVEPVAAADVAVAVGLLASAGLRFVAVHEHAEPSCAVDADTAAVDESFVVAEESCAAFVVKAYSWPSSVVFEQG